MVDKQVQILCDIDDENKDIIVQRMAVLQEAVQLNNLVVILCTEKYLDMPVAMLAVMSKTQDDKYAQYSPIGTIFYPDDNSYTTLIPPESAIPTDSSNVKH